MTKQNALKVASWVRSHSNPAAAFEDVDGTWSVWIESEWYRAADGTSGTVQETARSLAEARTILGY